jgi:transcriptional regulator with XRE-family HTH domain
MQSSGLSFRWRRAIHRGLDPEGVVAKQRQADHVTQIDRHVGSRVRERRIMLGITQQELAERLGVTYQQEHKYERGVNRISAGRLHQISQALAVPVGFFFEGLGDTPGRRIGERERMTLEVVRSFGDIDDPRFQQALAELARALADPNQNSDLNGVESEQASS